MEEPPNAHDAGPAQMNYKSHTSANTFIIPITCLTAAETFICPETYLQKLSAEPSGEKSQDFQQWLTVMWLL